MRNRVVLETLRVFLHVFPSLPFYLDVGGHATGDTYYVRVKICLHKYMDVKFTTFTHIYTITHGNNPPACAYTLLLSVAEVVAEIEVAWRFGDSRRIVWYGYVLQVQEPQLNLHREEDLQLAAHGFTAHLSAQEDVQPICP